MFSTVHLAVVKGDTDDIANGAVDQGTTSEVGDTGSEDFSMFLFQIFGS